ncbi:MAG: hypothetical protein GY746_07535, partial [Gammaproteobacteria bacterium]|nr:hypothetical protein [Gammaproteobacteria bacterium]
RVYFDIGSGSDGGDGKVFVFGDAAFGYDTDNDGAPDHLDLDSDNDGCTDANEAYADNTADGGDTGIFGTDTPTYANGGVDANGLVLIAGVTAEAYNTLPATTDSPAGNTFQIATQVVADATALVDQTVAAGSGTTFTITSATATNTTTYTIPGTPDYTAGTDVTSTLVYQWQEDGVDLSDGGIYSGTNTDELSISDVTGLGVNEYTLVVTHPDNVCLIERYSANLNSEICDNGIDDDGDGLIDCEDGDCYLVSNTGGTDTDGDGIDDNCDLDDDNDGILDAVESRATNGGINGPIPAANVSFDITGDVGNYLSPQILNSVTVNGTEYTNFIFPDTYASNFTALDNDHDIYNIQYGVRGPFYNTSPDWPADAIVSFQNRDLNYYHGNDASMVTLVDYIELSYATPILIADGMFVAFTERGGNNTVYIELFDINGTSLGTYQEIAQNSADYIDMGYPIAYNTTGGQQNVEIGIFPLADLGPVGSLVSSVRVYFDIGSGSDGGDGKVFVFGDAAFGYDTDNDGTPDHLDLDSDNDGCTDANEAYADNTADGGDTGIYGTDTPTLDNGGVDANGLVLVAGVTAEAYNTLPATTDSPAGNTFQIATQVVVDAAALVDQTIAAGSGTSFTITSTTATSTTDFTGTAPNTVPNYSGASATDVTSTLVFQWQVNGVDLSDGGVYSNTNTAVLSISDVTGLDGNVYNLVITHPDNVCIDEQNSATLYICDSPTLSLSSNSGSTCVDEAITISSNTFGGSATQVTITENGAGIINPSSTSTGPFSFTYTPAAGDAGNTVTITVTTDNPNGAPCVAAQEIYILTVSSIPTVTCPSNQSVCVDALPLDLDALAGESPTGGVFSGTGV